MDAGLVHRTVTAVLIAAAVTTGITAGAASAQTPTTTGSTAASVDGVAQQREARERALVKRIALRDPRPHVADMAWSALLSSRGAAAISEFLSPGGGLGRAIARAEATGDEEKANDALIAMLLDEPMTGPAVRTAARAAAAGTAADKEKFLITGLAAAEQTDRQAEQQKAAEAARKNKEDQDFATALSTQDPGLHVRAVALWAGRGPAQLEEFFEREWADAAGQDGDAYTRRVTEQEAGRKRRLTTLTDTAKARRQAETGTSGTAAQRARDATTVAWRQVAAHAETAAAEWRTEQQLAARHAEQWRWVADHASAASSDRNWAAIGATAQSQRKAWNARRDEASTSAAAWAAIAAHARAERT